MSRIWVNNEALQPAVEICQVLTLIILSVCLNLLSRGSVENEISLYVITTLFKHSSDENKESDQQGEDVLIFRQFLLTSSVRNVWRKVRRICILISGLKGLVQRGRKRTFAEN